MNKYMVVGEYERWMHIDFTVSIIQRRYYKFFFCSIFVPFSLVLFEQCSRMNKINFRFVCEFMCKCYSACVCSMFTHTRAFQKRSLALILSLFICICLPHVQLLSHDASTPHISHTTLCTIQSGCAVLERNNFRNTAFLFFIHQYIFQYFAIVILFESIVR